MAEERLVQREQWLVVYEEVKKTSMWGNAFALLNEHPGCSNNRKPGSGCTLLTQAMYFGVDKGVLEKLKACGADPTVLDNEGKLPIDHCPTAKRPRMEALLLQVYGADDRQARQELIKAAKEGNFVRAMGLLREKPHLVNTQSYRGWTLLHQACYHGASQSLLVTLVQMKACLEIKNDEGHTPQQVHELAHPDHRLTFPGSTTTTLSPGMEVFAHMVCGSLQGRLQEIEGDTATVAPAAGSPVKVPLFRVCAVETQLLDSFDPEDCMDKCKVCYGPACSSWKVSPDCSGPVHLLCGECMAAFLYAEFQKLPMKCWECEAAVDPAQIGNALGRSLLAHWPPRSRKETDFLSFDQFLQNVAEKMRIPPEEELRRHREEMLHLLATCGPTAVPIAYCGVGDCPRYRACPNCSTLIEYESQCKHFNCTQCQHSFCFLCLRSQAEHTGDGYSWNPSQACPLAPRQTDLP